MEGTVRRIGVLTYVITDLAGNTIFTAADEPLNVAHVLADAALSRKCETAAEQLTAFTLAKMLYRCAKGAQWSPGETGGPSTSATLEALMGDVARYGARQANVLVVGQVQEWLRDTAHAVEKNGIQIFGDLE